MCKLDLPLPVLTFFLCRLIALLWLIVNHSIVLFIQIQFDIEGVEPFRLFFQLIFKGKRQHKPQGEDKFCPMTLNGVTYKEKADAGEMLLAICKENPMSQPIEIGFSFSSFSKANGFFTSSFAVSSCAMVSSFLVLAASSLAGRLMSLMNTLALL